MISEIIVSAAISLAFTVILYGRPQKEDVYTKRAISITKLKKNK